VPDYHDTPAAEPLLEVIDGRRDGIGILGVVVVAGRLPSYAFGDVALGICIARPEDRGHDDVFISRGNFRREYILIVGIAKRRITVEHDDESGGRT
jgi:hypothetical protein